MHGACVCRNQFLKAILKAYECERECECEYECEILNLSVVAQEHTTLKF